MSKTGKPLPDTVSRGISLQAWAALLVLAVILPLGLYGWITLRSMARTQADAFTKNQVDTARVLASTVDSELHIWKAVVSVLAQSPSLTSGRLAEFYQEAKTVAAQHDGWIVLSDPSGQQLLNTLRPYGTPLPKSNPIIMRVLQAERPVVSDLFFGALAQRYILDVAVPVVRDGRPIYLLDLAFGSDQFTRLLQRQHLPAAWTLAIMDSQHRIVTRLPLTEERMGKPVQPWFEAALRSGDRGVVTGTDVQGTSSRVVFNRLSEAPWFLSLAIPLAALPSPRPVYWFIGLGALLGCCAVAVAVYASRKLTGPVTALAENAERVLRGEAVGPIPSGSREVQHLQEALVTAAEHAQALHEAEARAAVAEALQESEALLRAVTDNSPDAIYVKDRQSRWLMANPAVLHIVGKTAAQALGKTDRELYADPAIGRAILENDRRILERGRPEVFEEVADTPDGRRTFLSVKAPRRDAKGDIVGIIGISHDITARKQAEHVLRQAQAELESRVQERTAALQRLTEELEARVQARTADLEEANRRLTLVNAQVEDANVQLEEANAELEQEVINRKTAERALAAANDALGESEARYRGLVALAPDGVLVHQDWRIVYANAAAVRLYGAASPEQLCGRRLLDLIHAEDRQRVRARVGEVQAGHPVPVQDQRHRRLDGREVPVASTAAAVEWQGRPAVQVIVRDITARKQAEEALRESEARYRGVVEHTTAIILRVNPSGVITFANERALQFFGYAADELIGKPAVGTIIPAQETTGRDLAAMVEAITKDPDRFHANANENIRKNGERVWIEWTNSGIYDADGRLMEFLAVGIDATDRQRAEEALRQAHAELEQKVQERTAELSRAVEALRHAGTYTRSLIEASLDPLVTIGPDGRITDVNAASEAATGYPRSHLIGTDFSEYFTEPEKARAGYEQVFREGTVHDYPLELRHRDGHVTSVLYNASVYRDETGKAIGVFAAARDITKRKQAEDALRDRTEQLRALASELTLAEHRERERLALRLHDDLQQLLVGMKLVLSPLDRAEDPKVQEVGRELSELLMQSLACSRSLTEELSPPILHRSGLLPALDWLAKWMAERYHLRVAVRAKDPVIIESHETAVLLFRAIRELLFNVGKHAQVQAATVEIAQRDNLVRACVSDEGVGFDPTQLRMAGGSAGGFGLFNIRERLEYLGGGLDVESAPNKGSRFTIRLPLPQAVPPVETAAPVAPAATIAMPTTAAAGRKIRVLVVDDHRVVRQGLVRLLAAEPDIEVVGEAADGEKAAELAQELSPDVVTMDIEMPGMDGVEATRLIHKKCPATQVVGLSVHEENAQVAAIREVGAVAYVMKSAPAEELLAAIRACVS